MSDSDISLSDIESIEKESFSTEDEQTDDQTVSKDSSDNEDDDLGGIAYPSSEEEDKNEEGDGDDKSYAEKTIYASDIENWKESLKNIATVPLMDAVLWAKKIISLWSKMAGLQYSNGLQEKKRKGPIKGPCITVHKKQQKVRAETEDVEVAFFSLVFEDIFCNLLWTRLVNSGTIRPQNAHPEEMKRLRVVIKDTIGILCLIFTHTAPGSWTQTIILGEPLEHMLPFLISFPVAFTHLLKVLITKLWISPHKNAGNDGDEDENGKLLTGFKRLQGFLLATCRKHSSFAEKVVIKCTYASWIRSLFDMSIHKHVKANLLLGCLCELFFALPDTQKQYDFAFLSLRALALSVRSQLMAAAIPSAKKKSQLAAQGGPLSIPTQSWTFVYAIRFWSRIIGTIMSASPPSPSPPLSSPLSSSGREDSLLEHLNYPLVQIISAGIVASGKCPREIPYQLHLLECAISLLQVSAGFPLETLLRIIKETIESIQQQGKTGKKPADPTSLDWNSLLRGPVDAPGSSWYWDLLGRRASSLLVKCALLHSARADFPEVMGLPLRWVAFFLSSVDSELVEKRLQRYKGINSKKIFCSYSGFGRTF